MFDFGYYRFHVCKLIPYGHVCLVCVCVYRSRRAKSAKHAIETLLQSLRSCYSLIRIDEKYPSSAHANSPTFQGLLASADHCLRFAEKGKVLFDICCDFMPNCTGTIVLYTHFKNGNSALNFLFPPSLHCLLTIYASDHRYFSYMSSH